MVSYVALVAIVYDRSGHSGAWVAAVLVVMFGVTAAVGPWAGALGDRVDRRFLMIGSDLAAAATFVGIAFASGILGLCALLIATLVPPRRRDTADVDGAVTETVRPSRSEWSLAT